MKRSDCILAPLLIAMIAGCGPAPSTADLDADLATLESEIKDAESAVQKNAGMKLPEALAGSRLEALKHIKLMLTQKRGARIRGISLKYTVDGRPYQRPQDYEAMLKALENEIVEQKAQAISLNAKATGGGLFGAMLGATGQLAQLSVAVFTRRI